MPAVKVQASTKEVIISPLHAEALAMLLASRLTRALNYHQVTYKSDNQILVSTYRLVLVAGTPEALPPEPWALPPARAEVASGVGATATT
jgi:hypothetical protein